MGIRQKIGEKKTHLRVLGKGGLDFLKGRYTFAEGEVIRFNATGYKNKFHLRSKTSDIPTFYQCIFDKEYDINLDFTPQVIVDLGGNIGLTTAFFKSKYPAAKIITVEPESSNFDLLTKNLEGLENVFPIKAAVWNESTELEIVDNGQGHYGYTVQPVEQPTENSFKAVGIQEIMEMHTIDQIDVLKIDIEGAEKELFEKNYAYWLERTKVVIVELHDRFKPGCSKAVFQTMVKFNFDFSIKGENVIFYLK